MANKMLNIKIELPDQNLDNDDKVILISCHPSIDILSDNIFKLNKDFVIQVAKDSEIDRKHMMDICKVLEFTNEWNIIEIIAKLSDIKPINFPNLFIFIIKSENVNSTELNELKESLIKFCQDRPMILQLRNENSTTFYYKEDSTEEVILIDSTAAFEDVKDFSTFLLSFLSKKFDNFEEKLIDRLPSVKNSSLILRFLRTLKLSNKFLGELILEVTKNGKKENFLAVLDVPFGDDGRKLNYEAQNILSNVFEENQFITKDPSPFNRIPSEEEKVNTNVLHPGLSIDSSKRVSANLRDFPKKVSTPIPSKQLNPSVLHAAIENKNELIIDYLITYWSHLIRELPFNHQVDISTIAFKTSQLNILCDLLEISDFPFPKDFKEGDESCDERLQQITKTRMQLMSAIQESNLNLIDDFIANNLNLKVIYTPNNKSVMQQAVDFKNCSVYFHLKSFGYKATEFKNLEDVLFENDLKEANEQKLQQRRFNVQNAHQTDLKSINTLRNKSCIHNRKINKELEIEYHTKIKEWFKDIKKVEGGPDFLDVAASCDYLKIIFDFESSTVENASLSGPSSLGVLYSLRKLIFIGAKQLDKYREQQIKGVLAHELCHYVMKLVYQNQEKPYFADRTDIMEIFENIVKQLNKWTDLKQEIIEDDECNEIISSVFRLYDKEDHHVELIVRVLQILVEFDYSEEYCAYLQNKYKILFDFWNDYVMPDVREYLQKNKDVIKMNESFGILDDINDENYQLKGQDKVKGIDEHKLLIITTNVRKLLLVDIYKYLQDKFGVFMDSMYLFVNPKKLNKKPVMNDFSRISFENKNLNFIIDCTKGLRKDLGQLFVRKDFNCLFIVPNNDQIEELLNIIDENKTENPTIIEISYNWTDLARESQQQLLNTEVIFQNIMKTTFMDLLSKDIITEVDKTQVEKMINDFNDVTDDQLLDMLVNKSNITINSTFEYENFENNFDLLFELREYVKKVKNAGSNKMLTMLKENVVVENFDGGPLSIPETRQKTKINETISQEELLDDVKNKPYVLISDIAGTGKSWAMKDFAKVLSRKYSRKWVTYVDLKQFIESFKSEKSEPDFASFVADKMLKPKMEFERKLFKKFYKNGKTIVLMDGFDEIAPNCAEYVSKLIKSFKYNGGNQLWIATRDYFEVDLQTSLQLDVAYKLGTFTKENGINLIVANWILKDLKHKNVHKNIDLKQYIRSHGNYKNYCQKAMIIVNKVGMTKNRTVGLPQLFHMIAHGLKDDLDSKDDLTGSEIYKKFASSVFKRWSDEKGQIRKDASSQDKDLDFYKFHHYSAVASLFPEMAKILFPYFDEKEWPDAEIIAGGLMSKRGGKFYFLHETFREYFFTVAISKAMKNLKIVRKSIIARLFGWKYQDDLILELFIQILTVEKFGVIRMFLNDTIKGSLNKSQSELQVICHKLYEMENFEEFFIKHLEHLADFLIAVFKNGNYEMIKNILIASAWNIITKTEDSKMFIKFQDFLFDFLKVNDFKTFIIDQEIFHAIIRSCHSIKVFEDFLVKTESKIDRAFIRKGLQMYSKNDWNGNIFYFLCESSGLNIFTVQKFLEILQRFLTTGEIFKLVEKCNKYGQNVFQFCVRSNDKEYFDMLWNEIKKIFPFQSFKQLILQRDSLFCENISHSVILRKETEIHDSLWLLLLEVFNDSELKTFILQIGQFENNFVYKLIELNENPDVIELTFKMFKMIFVDLNDLLASKSFLKMNLLHAAAANRKSIKIHKFLWKVFRETCDSNHEYLEILKQTDRFGCNVLHHAVENSSNEVFEFMMDEFKEIGSTDDIRFILRNLGQHRRNVLQSAVKSNKCPKLHANLWKTLRFYFNDDEILNLINHVNKKEENLLILAVENNTKEIMDQTWIEIKGSFKSKEQMIEYLKMKEWKESKHINRHFDNWRCKNEIHEWVKSLVNC